jgi:hypothetical protein
MSGISVITTPESVRVFQRESYQITDPDGESTLPVRDIILSPLFTFVEMISQV